MVGYRDIAQHYRTLILTGQLRHGDALPSARELAKEFEVTAKTAHNALTELRLLELVKVTPRGFEVIYRFDDEVTLQVPIDGPRLRGFEPLKGLTRAIVRAGLSPTPPAVANVLGIDAGATAVLREGHVIRDGQVIGHATSWFPAHWAELVPELLHAVSTAPGSVARIEAVIGHPTEVSVDWFEPDVASEELAELFGVPVNDPVMVRATTRYDGQDVVECGRLTTRRGVKIQNVYRRPSEG